MKLVSNGKGLSSYDTADHQYRVFKKEGRSWSGRRGHYAWTKWEAISLTETDSRGVPLVVASASTLIALQKRLEHYLSDKESRCVQNKSKYGVF